MRSMLDQGNAKNILNAVQSENRVSPDRLLIVKNAKKDQSISPRTPVSRS